MSVQAITREGAMQHCLSKVLFRLTPALRLPLPPFPGPLEPSLMWPLSLTTQHLRSHPQPSSQAASSCL
eukprot:scaffold172958_cov36-Tisochrysis_lutea.AAC.1